MAFKINNERQEVITASVDVGVEDLTNAVPLSIIELPANSEVVGGFVRVVTKFNSRNGDKVTLMLEYGSSREILFLPKDVKTKEESTFIEKYLGSRLSELGNISLVWESIGTTATEGKLRITVLYRVEGRSSFSQG